MDIAGIGRTQAPNIHLLDRDTSSVASQGNAFTAPPPDRVPQYWDPLGKETPHGDLRTVELATHEMAGPVLKNCRKILPRPGSAILLPDRLPKEGGFLLHGSNEFAFDGPYVLRHRSDGGYSFAQADGPRGRNGRAVKKTDILTIMPNGEVRYTPGRKPYISPDVNPTARRANAKNNMLQIMESAVRLQVGQS
jgi:hypothetical protein